MAMVRPVIWSLLEVLLPLGLLEADPAEPVITLRALDLGASSTHESNPHSAFLVGARFRAILEVNVIQFGLHELILFCNLLHEVLILDKQVDSID